MNKRGGWGIWQTVILFVVALVLAILISMWLDNTRQPPGVTANPECPHTYDSTYALPAEITNIPEYHDCQKLIKADDETYGALAAVFVRKNLDTIRIPAVSVKLLVGAPPRLTPTGARLGTSAFIPTAAQEPQVRASAIAIAEIKSWDEGYPELGISQGTNCLYVTRVQYLGVAGYEYAALMIPLSSGNDSVCLPRGAPAQGGTWLKVVHRSLSAGEAAFPAVARWDRDETHKQHYVSMLCDTDWCEVGNSNFTPVPTRDVTAGTAVQQSRWEQKGYYDEQRLAVMVGGQLRPSNVLATASPHPDLVNYSDASFGEWKPVAKTVLPTDLPPYDKKLNFRAGSVPTVTNEVSLCHGKRFFGGCLPFLAALQTMFTVPCWKSSDDGQFWWAKIVSSNGGTSYRCTNRITHGMQNVPDAARWRWKMNDEGLWTRCAAGCCEVYGKN